ASGLMTVARMSSVCGTVVVTVPTVQRPVLLSYAPTGVADTKLRPAGSGSLTTTLVAVLGPLLVSLRVKVMVSPTLGVGLLINLARARSAACGFVEVVAVLLPVLGSNWSLWLIEA